MTSIKFSEFVARLARPNFRPASKARLAIAEQPNPFVPPPLSSSGPVLQTPEIIFVSASAAVGKSTVAKFLSASIGAPILDLSRVPVSTGSLHTLILELKGSQKEAPLDAFHAGQLPIIIDALDEGRLLSGETGIEHFLITTAELLASVRTETRQPKLIFFGRYESVALARSWIELTAPDISLQGLEVGFFDKEGAWALIDAYAKHDAKPHAAYLRNPEPVKKLIEAYFDAIESALGVGKGNLWSAEQGKAFAGYAPVLAAVGSLLSEVENFITITNDLKNAGDREAWAVIETVLGEILDREQKKLCDQFKSHSNNVPSEAYDPNEQMALLAQYVDSRPLSGTGRVKLPQAEMSKYQEMVELYVPEHPFIRQHEFGNDVLGSVIIARSIFYGRPVSPERLRNLSRQPFLWRSISQYLSVDSVIGGDQVGHLFNSFWNDPLNTNSPDFKTHVRPSDDPNSALIYLPTKKNEYVGSFSTLPIKFYGAIRNCEIDTESTIVLEGIGASGAGKMFRLYGPIVVICSTAEIDSDHLRFEGEIWLEAKEIVASANLKLDVNGAKLGWGGQFAKQFPWNRVPSSLSPPHQKTDTDHLTGLVRECSQRFLSGVSITVHPDFSPAEGDPQMRWAARRYADSFPNLMRVMHSHGLATSEALPAAGQGKVRVRFIGRWSTILDAILDPKSQPDLIPFVTAARREIK